MDWPACILFCCETIICCCTNIYLIAKCFKTQENNFTTPENPQGTYITEQPYSPQRYHPQEFRVQSPSATNELNPSARFPEINLGSNQSTVVGIASTNYLAPPPSYSEAVSMEIPQAQSSNFPDRHISKNQ